MALTPLVAVLVAALVIVLQAHRAGEAAGVAVHAAGVAALIGRDPIAAARTAAPDIERDRLRVERRGRRITVRVRAEGPRSLVRTFDAERTVVVATEAGR